MARIGKKRYINTRFWEDVYISNLDPIEKLLFLYFITNTHTNISGVYEIPIKTVAVDTGVDKEMVEKVISRFSKDKKVYYIKGWICVMNFHKHQGDSPSIKQGIENAMNDVPQEIILKMQQKDTQSPHSVDTVPPQPDLSKSKSISESIIPEPNSGNSSKVINLFKEINPSYKTLFNRKPQHDASNRLLEREGFEKLEQAINFLKLRYADKFCPQISTPYQLEEKWASLTKYALGLKSSINNNPKWKIWT